LSAVPSQRFRLRRKFAGGFAPDGALIRPQHCPSLTYSRVEA